MVYLIKWPESVHGLKGTCHLLLHFKTIRSTLSVNFQVFKRCFYSQCCSVPPKCTFILSISSIPFQVLVPAQCPCDLRAGSARTWAVSQAHSEIRWPVSGDRPA
ncbi:hypothetical protein GDO81_027152 [Engystomops pustulosus]|uniref:Uncharacterized protein n=1 Tax=Engystomops pustulosus TaxID=76066 RepID=A0AAV6YEU7_ENGPU|nr:hypothetical protein GDO81_027152 [Engystomops pustulosus]